MARRRTRIRFLLALTSLGLLAAALLTGCLSSPAPEQPEDEAQEPSDDPQDLIGAGAQVPEHLLAGVHSLTRPVFDEGGALGYVFDEGSRELVPEAVVVAQCQRSGLDLPVNPRIVETDASGRFAITPPGSFSDCATVTYQALKPGYQGGEGVSSGPLGPDSQILILIGLQPRS